MSELLPFLVHITTVNVQSGKVMDRSGPFESAYLARVACGRNTGQALLWTRDDQYWVAQKFPLEYRVSLDPADRFDLP
ncbi:hypothetical protein [Deinococcus hohokamensis]|uniref:Uncharacterized protein n=1 Tax=Deinococcus hohokamensis TaxID=309883 RepID=A0ABV9IA25_9DEIO